jgi:hypothetical protein
LLDGLPQRLSSTSVLLSMTLAAGCVAVVIAANHSLTHGQAAAIAAAALAGCFAASCLSRDKAIGRGLCLPYAVIVGGWAFVGCVEPQPPLWGLLIAPAAPLVLWCFALPPLSRLRGYVAAAAQTGAFLVVLAVVAWLSLAATE